MNQISLLPSAPNMRRAGAVIQLRTRFPLLTVRGDVLPGGVVGLAMYSPCERYRYLLSREWGDVTSRLAVCAMNPSTATESEPDATVNKLVKLAKREGFGALDVLNVFAWRSKDRKVLANIEDPIGPANDDVIRSVTHAANRVLVAWGNEGALGARYVQVARLIDGLRVCCYGLNKATGQPTHPLYQPDAAVLVPWVAS